MSPARRASVAKADFSAPDEAVRALCERLPPVNAESVPLAQAVGRVLAAPIVADRDSPPCDVSAMDGYAVRLADLNQPVLEVAGEAAIGQAAPPLPPGAALRIFTGAPVPPEAELVIQREDVVEDNNQIKLRENRSLPVLGLNIRRRGENLHAGETVLEPGTVITPAAIAALASFGAARLSVHRRVRVAVIITGSELVSPDASAQPWQIRDANGPALAALLCNRAELELRAPVRIRDDAAAMGELLARTMAESDAVLLTGGVSAGQYDFVLEVVTTVGGETVFHRLPMRPGRPVLGAVGPQGQAVLGLPGNPVSVLVAGCRLAGTVLRHLAGVAAPFPRAPLVRLINADEKTLPLWWFRLVRLGAAGTAELVSSQGSGDVAALGRCDGFVELPPQAAGAGPWPFFSWES